MTALPELRGSRLTLGEDGVATLTFARDDVRNALTGTGLIPDIVETCDWANCNPAPGGSNFKGPPCRQAKTRLGWCCVCRDW